MVANDVNLLALGELRTNRTAAAAEDLLYVTIGTGIGAGLVSGGRLHRGTNGSAGDVGHVAVAEAENVICRCGNAGCLEAIAGGATLATLVCFYNPALVVLGGGVVSAGDHVLAAIRESVDRQSLPLATRTLRIELSSLGDAAAWPAPCTWCSTSRSRRGAGSLAAVLQSGRAARAGRGRGCFDGLSVSGGGARSGRRAR